MNLQEEFDNFQLANELKELLKPINEKFENKKDYPFGSKQREELYDEYRETICDFSKINSFAANKIFEFCEECGVALERGGFILDYTNVNDVTATEFLFFKLLELRSL